MNASEFGARYRRALKHIEVCEGGGRISDREIADRLAALGFPRKALSTVGRWRRGESIPDVHTIYGLAKACQVEPSWIAFGEGTPPDFGR